MMTPKELRDLADLIERGRAYATAHAEMVDDRHDYLGEVVHNGARYPTRQTQDTKIRIEVTCLGPLEVFIRDMYDPQGSWKRCQ